MVAGLAPCYRQRAMDPSSPSLSRSLRLLVFLSALVAACSGESPPPIADGDVRVPTEAEDRPVPGEAQQDGGGVSPDGAGPGTGGAGDAGGADGPVAGGGDGGVEPDAGLVSDAGSAVGGPGAGDAGPIPLDGGTVITSTLTGTLTRARSPYRVIGDAQGIVTIPKGQVLRVEPGVVLDFRGRPEVSLADVDPRVPGSVMNHHKGRVELRVYGGIQVRGTEASPIVFTSTNPYGWWGINFFGAQSVGDGHPVFEHMIFEKVRKNDYNGGRDRTRGAMWAYYPGPVTIVRSTFRDNMAAAKCGALDLMFTVGSRVEGNLFENNRTSDIDRFGQPGSFSMAGGAAMCVTHGRDSVVRGNTFRGNVLEAFRGAVYTSLVLRPLLQWPNPQGTYDLGGGGALHYFQPNNDLIENNLFANNTVLQGPASALYLEDVGTRAVTLRGNHFIDNRAGAGGVVVCNRGSGGVELVLAADNVFTRNQVNGVAAPRVTGDCTTGAQEAAGPTSPRGRGLE